jgi:two-component system, chemotaxis family, chemotaxis protein CheY
MDLAVDDEHSILVLVQEVLTAEGIEVRTARNGREALQVVQECNPELILLDMRMPIMNGWEFAAAYRQLPPPHAPLVVVTAGLDGKKKAADITAAGLLTKPFEIDDLLATVRRYGVSG